MRENQKRVFLVFLAVVSLFILGGAYAAAQSLTDEVQAWPWELLGPSGGNVQSIVPHPHNSQEIYIMVSSVRTTIYKTRNQGWSWTRIACLNRYGRDMVIDPLALSVGADQQAAVTTLETARLITQELGVNMTLGGSNVSFGLPDREGINGLFLGLVLAAGVTCPIVNPKKARQAILVADLLLGKDEYAMRYISYVRERL